MNYIITAGGTSEPIDRVRKITNMSKGTLGVRIAQELLSRERTKKVYFIAPREVVVETKDARFEHVVASSTQQVHDALELLLTNEKRVDAVIHSMAISDYTVDYVFDLEALAQRLEGMQSEGVYWQAIDYLNVLREGAFRLNNSSKLSSSAEDMTIKLKKTEKIIGKIKEWKKGVTLVGFKLLENVSSEELLNVARAQMKKNDCDYVFANDIAKIRQTGHQGFLLDAKTDSTNEIYGINEIAVAIADALEGADTHV
jgi:phosphopantothenate-cysteine ligase